MLGGFFFCTRFVNVKHRSDRRENDSSPMPKRGRWDEGRSTGASVKHISWSHFILINNGGLYSLVRKRTFPTTSWDGDESRTRWCNVESPPTTYVPSFIEMDQKHWWNIRFWGKKKERILSTTTPRRREKPETLFGQQETHPQIRPRSLGYMRRVGGPHCGASYNTFPFPIVKMRKRQIQNKRKSGKKFTGMKNWVRRRLELFLLRDFTTKANDNTHYSHQMFDDVLKDLYTMVLLHP